MNLNFCLSSITESADIGQNRSSLGIIQSGLICNHYDLKTLADYESEFYFDLAYLNRPLLAKTGHF